MLALPLPAKICLKVTDQVASRRQVRFSASSQVTQRWDVSGGAVFDLISPREQPQALSLAVRYRNECCTATLTYTRSLDLLSDTKPTNRFLISIVFKYLGEIKHGI